MDLTLEQLALRVPEIAAAALRERLPLAAVRGCPAGSARRRRYGPAAAAR